MKKNTLLKKVKQFAIISTLLFYSQNIFSQSFMPIPNQNGNYNGTRGFWFIAPTNFIITGLRVPTDASSGAQSVQVIKINGNQSISSGSFTSFTSLTYHSNVNGTGIINTHIQINSGDSIVILGTRGTITSYGPSPYNSSIGAFPVTIYRANSSIGHLSTSAASSIRIFDQYQLGRIEMYYDLFVPTLTINSHQTSRANPNGEITTQVSGGTPPYTYEWSNSSTTASISGLTAGTYTVTISDNSSPQKTSVNSATILEEFPPVLISVQRNNPMSLNTSSDTLQFKLTFDQPIGGCSTTDFIGTNALANNLTINSIETENDSTVLVNTSLNTNNSGNVGLGIKGVGGLSGINNIKRIQSNQTIASQLSTNDYLGNGRTKVGQTFKASFDGFFTGATFFFENGHHYFNDSANYQFFIGDEDAGGATLVSSKRVFISGSTASTGQTFAFDIPIAIDSGQTYTLLFNHFANAASGLAFQAAANTNPYVDGQIIFSGNSSSHRSGFDLKFIIKGGKLDNQSNLDTTTAIINELYSYAPPASTLKLISMIRHQPLGVNTIDNSLQFKVDFSEPAYFVDSTDFEIVSNRNTVKFNEIQKTNDSTYLISITQDGLAADTISLNLKGIDGTGINDISNIGAEVIDIDHNYHLTTWNSTNNLAQSFEAGASGALTSFSIAIPSGIPATQVRVYAGDGFSGALLTEENLPANSGSGFQNFLLTNPPKLVQGQFYTIHFIAQTSFHVVVDGNPIGNGKFYSDSVDQGIGMNLKTFIAPIIKVLNTDTLPQQDEFYNVIAPLSITMRLDSNVSCNGTPSGGATAIISGGQSPYLFHWSNGAFTSNISGIVAGKYQVTVTDNNGSSASSTQTRIDSITITEPNAITTNDTITVCDSFLWTANNTSYNQTGNYVSTISAANGCDSTVSLNLTVLNSTSQSFTANECNSYVWQGMTFTQSGTYYDTIPNAAGCDSLMTLNLTIRNQTSETFTADVCNSYD
ncbi:MAG: SprB repeat-containing protein, partial [Flavobacteriales bacterium]|nr:SprB repeat-containing protein [Flavobacteriales bacterium]